MEDQKEYTILSLTGHHGSGKTTISNKLVRDQKYHRIIISEDDRKNQGQEELVSNLIRKVKQSPNKKILLEGFPLHKKQALIFENQFASFQLLIFFQCSHEVLISRTLLKQKDQSPEDVKTIIQNNQAYLKQLSDFYSKFGLLYSVKNEDDPDQVYQDVKKILLPNIIFLYGPPKNGKSQISKQLQARIGYRHVSLRQFYSQRQNKPKLQIVNQFIGYLRKLHQKCFIIDDLFETKDEYLVFQKQMGHPERIFYLDSHKDQVEISISNKCEPKDKQQNRNIYLKFVENRQKLMHIIKDRNFFRKIRGNQSPLQIQKSIIQDLKPTVVAAFCTTQEQSDFLKEFQRKADWKIIDIEQMKTNHAERRTDIGKKVQNSKNNNKMLPIKVTLDILRQCMFGKPYKKIIIVNLGDKTSLYQKIEQQLFQIGLLQIEFQKKGEFKPVDHPLLHYFEKGKLYKIRQKRPELLDSMLHSSIKYGLLFGPPSSGKTTLVKNLSKQYGMVQVEWQGTIQKVRQKYLTEEQKNQDEVPTYKILKYLKDTFQNSLDKTFILDGLPNDKMLPQVKKHLGNPTFILNKKISKQALIQRIRIKQSADSSPDLSAEITEEQTQKIDDALKKGQIYVNWSRQLSQNDATIKSYSIDSSGTIQNTLTQAGPLFSRRVYIVYNQVQETNSLVRQSITNLFRNIAYVNDLLYINVDNLVKESFENKNCQLGDLLRSEYQLKTKQIDKHNAQSYSPAIVMKLIKKHIDSTNQQYKDFMLIDYPKPKKQDDNKFPLISDQLASIQNSLGDIKIIISVTKNPIQYTINDPQLNLQKPEAPEVISKQGQQTVGQEKPSDDQPKKPAFNIYDYQWSNCSTPKTIAQWYCSLKSNTDKIKLNMSNYEDISLYDQFPKYVEEVKKNNSSNFFIQVQRQF